MAAIQIQGTLRREHTRRARGPRRALAHLGVSVALALALPAAALAQEDAQQKAAAEALFDEGRELIGQGQYEAACRRFEQSQAIDPGVGTLLYLGDCYERLGRFASAWAMYREARSSARAAGQGERARVADERARHVAPNLSKLAVMVAAENRIEGFELVINGRLLSPALFGAALPIDAGRYQLVARAPGRTAWSALVDVKPDGDQQLVQVPPLAAAAVAGPPLPGQGGAPTPAIAASAEPVVADDSEHWLGLPPQQTAGVLVAGGGVLALGTGVVLGLLAKGKDDDASDRCVPSCLDRSSADLNEDARGLATAANISYGIGLAALTTGAVLYFSGAPQPSDAPSSAGFRVSPRLARESQGVLVEGTF
jgi:tetratricopeptide (TPR) repeat protein